MTTNIKITVLLFLFGFVFNFVLFFIIIIRLFSECIFNIRCYYYLIIYLISLQTFRQKFAVICGWGHSSPSRPETQRNDNEQKHVFV